MHLPLHPQCSIVFIEEVINGRMTALWNQFREALERSHMGVIAPIIDFRRDLPSIFERKPRRGG